MTLREAIERGPKHVPCERWRGNRWETDKEYALRLVRLALEQAAVRCEDEEVDAAGTGDAGDRAYNLAIKDCAMSIRALAAQLTPGQETRHVEMVEVVENGERKCVPGSPNAQTETPRSDALDARCAEAVRIFLKSPSIDGLATLSGDLANEMLEECRQLERELAACKANAQAPSPRGK